MSGRRALVLVGLVGLGACSSEFSVDTIDPSVVTSLVATPALIHGSGFTGLVRTRIDDRHAAAIDLQFGVTIGDRALAPGEVARLDDQTLSLMVPAGLAPGAHDVTVTAPSGAARTLAQALRVNAPPTLSATAMLSSSTLAVGQRFDFVVSVDCGGEETVLGVVPATPELTGSAVLAIDGALPGPVDLDGGGHAEFVFHYRAVSAGDLTIATTATATGAGGSALASNRVEASAVVSTAPVLSATLELSTTAVSTDEAFTLTLLVTNHGETVARTVAALPPVLGGDGTVALTATPSAADIAPGASVAFVWSYVATGPGTVTWTVDAAGVDVIGNPAVVPSVSAGPLTIHRPSLSAALTAVPSPATAVLSTGQTLLVTLTVTNDGTSLVTEVAPTAPTVGGTAGATVLAAPSTPVSLAPGASTQFEWTYETTAAGELVLTAQAIGHDPGSGKLVASPFASSASLTIVKQPTLSALVAVAPATVTVGEIVQVDVTVQNSGDVAADAVAVASLAPSNPALVALQSSPTAEAIPPGEARVFTSLWKAVGAGTTTFAVTASGNDANRGTTVASALATSGPLVVQLPASLVAEVAATPSPVFEGGTITVVVTMRNVGEATAHGVAPTLVVAPLDGALLLTSPVQSSVDLAGGAEQTFTWTYRAEKTGTVGFAVGASAKDANSGAAVSAAPVQASINVTTHAALTAALTAPATVKVGDSFVVTLTITNVGGDAATGIIPAPLVSTGAGVSLVSGPTPSTAPGALAPNGTTSFAWTYAAGPIPGTVTFSGAASGVDAVDASAVVSPTATALPVTIGNPARLSSALSLPATLTRGAAFTVTMQVDNPGGNLAHAVAPSLLVPSGTGAAKLASGPSPSSAEIAPGASATFTWTYVPTANGTLSLRGNAVGSDAMTLLGVASLPTTSMTATITDFQVLASDPFGDGTAFSFVFPYAGYMYLGPRGDGVGAVRMNPDGSGLASVSFSIEKDDHDHAMANKSAAPYHSLGYTGCVADTPTCGPDNENGRGLFATGTVKGVPWLVIGGARSAQLGYLYATSDTTTAAPLAWLDFGKILDPTTRAVTAIHVFNDEVYVGFNGTSVDRPTLGRIEAMPSSPGVDISAGDGTYTDLRAGDVLGVAGLANPAMIDAIGDYKGNVYYASSDAWVRSTSSSPPPYVLGNGAWTYAMPLALDYLALASTKTTKLDDLEPADRAVPAFAAFGERYFAARNTNTGPQLWSCNAERTGDAEGCDPGDWSLVARNTIGDTRLSQFNDTGNTAITLLVATSTHLYVGFNNATGVQLWRTSVDKPSALGDFEGLDGCAASLHSTTCAPLGGAGFGDAAGNTRLFSGAAATFAGRDHLYVVSGNGKDAIRVVHAAN